MTQAISVTEVREQLRTGVFTGTWQLDPMRSTATLSTRSMWGMAPVKGTFTRLSGHAVADRPTIVSGQVSVDATSFDSKNVKRDTHLRSKDFFNVDVHPDIVFVVDKVASSNGALLAVGQLSVAGVSRPLDVPFTVSALDADTVRLDAKVKIDRSDWGLTWNQMGMASMKNVLTVSATFTRQPK